MWKDNKKKGEKDKLLIRVLSWITWKLNHNPEYRREKVSIQWHILEYAGSFLIKSYFYDMCEQDL